MPKDVISFSTINRAIDRIPTFYAYFCTIWTVTSVMPVIIIFWNTIRHAILPMPIWVTNFPPSCIAAIVALLVSISCLATCSTICSKKVQKASDLYAQFEGSVLSLQNHWCFQAECSICGRCSKYCDWKLVNEIILVAYCIFIHSNNVQPCISLGKNKCEGNQNSNIGWTFSLISLNIEMRVKQFYDYSILNWQACQFNIDIINTWSASANF